MIDQALKMGLKFFLKNAHKVYRNDVIKIVESFKENIKIEYKEKEKESTFIIDRTSKYINIANNNQNSKIIQINEIVNDVTVNINIKYEDRERLIQLKNDSSGIVKNLENINTENFEIFKESITNNLNENYSQMDKIIRDSIDYNLLKEVLSE